MEDVKDTLWKWIVQLTTLANWGWELWGIWLWAPTIRDMLSLGPTPMPSQVISIIIAAMLALASLFYWRLLHLRKWTAWIKVAASGAHVFRSVTASELGLSHWTAQLALATVIILAHSLLFKGKLWRGGF